MAWGIIITMAVYLMLLHEGYRAGESRNMGGAGGVILVLLFNILGLVFIYLSPKE